jgi:cytochrome c biogenesis protein
LTNETSGLPERPHQPESPFKQILDILSSMQLGIILLLLLAVISVFATLRPMDEAIENIYTSWWFIGIMSFTALNLLLCTVERIGPLYRQAFRPRLEQSFETVKKMSVSRTIRLKKAGDEPLSGAMAAFKANGLSARIIEDPNGKLLFGEKGRLGYFGSVITHLSLLLILLAAMYGWLTGYETQGGGRSGESFFVREGNFHVNIHEVKKEYLDEDGMVRPRAKSNISVTRRGEEIGRQLVSINVPLRFEGVTIYHSTFLWVSQLTITDPQTGESEGPVKLLDGDRYTIEDKGISVSALAFFPNFTMTPEGRPTTSGYKPNRPVLAYRIVEEGGQQRQWDLLELGVPKTVETAAGPLELTLSGFETAAVYSIAKNLGRPYLFIGSMLMMVGMYMSFFLSPRRFYAVFDGKSSTLAIGGRGYRNKLLIEQIMERIETELQQKEEV